MKPAGGDMERKRNEGGEIPQCFAGHPVGLAPAAPREVDRPDDRGSISGGPIGDLRTSSLERR